MEQSDYTKMSMDELIQERKRIKTQIDDFINKYNLSQHKYFLINDYITKLCPHDFSGSVGHFCKICGIHDSEFYNIRN